MPEAACVVLGGGQGRRLFPLTKERAKPAVPMAGKYRLIDIPLSNCINSRLTQIYVVTQCNSVSLHRHITQTYTFDAFSSGFVELLAAEQTMESVDWYLGTADAVRQHLQNLQLERNSYVLILGGDHLYRMDYRHLLASHVRNAAEITVAAMPVPEREATGLGILQTDADNRIVRFAEKPPAEELSDLRSDAEAIRHQGIEPGDRHHVASMGIYVFNSSVLREVLEDPAQQDFGQHVIPGAVGRRRLYGFYFDGYWRDIGTVRSFYEANLDLVADVPPFNFFDETAPMYTRARQLCPAKLNDCRLDHCLLADGAVLDNCEARRSVIGVRSTIRAGTRLDEAVLLGADFYEHGDEGTGPRHEIPLGIGAGCVIRRAIIDKNVRLGDGVTITNERGVEHEDGDGYYVRDGIVIVPRSAAIPSGTVI